MRTLFLAMTLLLALPSVLACGPYTLGFYEYGALYYRGENGRWEGLDKDLVEELARRSGCRFETRLESRVRIWAQLAEGQLDATVSAMPTPERERLVEFLPYIESRQYVLLQPELAARLGSTAAFSADAGRKLLVVRGYVHTPSLQAWVDTLRTQGRVVEAPDQPSAMRAFKAQRADAMILGANSLAAARRNDRAFAAFAALPYAPQEHTVGALALSRERVSAADRALLRQTLLEMQRDGSLAALKRRHLGELLAGKP
ncbi:substrate-binding periplasmic protein [Paucibacter sp. XJ19-41]|uniref:substrate-binding periplasmic protein n=1 Tax=Paucibacter sp. XJ19-41 TaxID=2927824 RepID=UPI00234BBE01|nr:transporter substrate-binding domain-containing protein [Paucibacter sp. XJ19-41]MDC6167647.1 transporter substrate-binding domain-containing protein [Paucibacter sp. XJ19-41]